MRLESKPHHPVDIMLHGVLWLAVKTWPPRQCKSSSTNYIYTNVEEECLLDLCDKGSRVPINQLNKSFGARHQNQCWESSPGPWGHTTIYSIHHDQDCGWGVKEVECGMLCVSFQAALWHWHRTVSNETTSIVPSFWGPGKLLELPWQCFLPTAMPALWHPPPEELRCEDCTQNDIFGAKVYIYIR